MMKIRHMFAFAALTATAAAFAQTATFQFDANRSNQERRIQQGVESGQLTGKEAARLEQEKNRILQTQEKAKADGVVTDKERAQLKKMEDRRSKNIAREKHDVQRDMNRDGENDRKKHNRGRGWGVGGNPHAK